MRTGRYKAETNQNVDLIARNLLLQSTQSKDSLICDITYKQIDFIIITRLPTSLRATRRNNQAITVHSCFLIVHWSNESR